MRKIIILTIMVVSLLFITGCGDEGTQTAGTGAFIGGTLGVVSEFELFNIENSIYDEETFPIEVKLMNKGEYDLKQGDVNVELKGPILDFDGIPSLTLTNQEEIEKISELYVEGGEDTLTFTSDAKYNQVVPGSITREWYANVEYNYETYLIIPEVCLKEDLKEERVCEVKEAKTFFVSGAPVTVKSVEEDTAGKGIIALKIKVGNVGIGDITKQGEKFGTYDTLAYEIDDPSWECKSSGKVNEAKLTDGETNIVCKLKEALAEDVLATKQLGLTFRYTYRNLIQQPITIQQSIE